MKLTQRRVRGRGVPGPGARATRHPDGQPRNRHRPAGHRRAALRRAGPLALAAAAAVLAGCSSGGAPAGAGGAPVASLPGHGGATAAAQPLTAARSDQDMVDFTRCMRAHGVAMPDPVHRPGHQGLSLNLPTRDAATHAAYQACTHFIGPIIAAKQAGGAALAAPRLAALTRYAQCMRSHDIAMLDPDQDGNLNLGHVPGMTADFGRYSPQFRAADTACRPLLPAGVHDDGTGP
jgi:hypothetical protein